MNYHVAPSPGSPEDALYAERVAPVDALHVACDDDLVILQRAKQLVIETSRATGEIVFLTGAPMSGRSEKVRLLEGAQWLAPTLHPNGKTTTPFLSLDARAQSQANKWIVCDAIAGVGDAPKDRLRNERRRLQHAKDCIFDTGNRLIAITNADHMLRGKHLTELDDMAGRLALLTSETRISIILTGGEMLARFMRDRPDLLGSVSHLPLRPISTAEEFAEMLAAFERAGGLEANPKLHDKNVVGVLLDLTQGLHGRAAHLLRESSKAAVFDDVGMISVDHLITVSDRMALCNGDNPLVQFL